MQPFEHERVLDVTQDPSPRLIPDGASSSSTVTKVRELAAALILEHLGDTPEMPTPTSLDGSEMCAALAWAIAVTAAVGADGEKTIQRCATDGHRNAVVLVTAMLDGGDDVAEAAITALDGQPVIVLCHELFQLARLVCSQVRNSDAVRAALLG